jgi:hypothetical protein
VPALRVVLLEDDAHRARLVEDRARHFNLLHLNELQDDLGVRTEMKQRKKEGEKTK